MLVWFRFAEYIFGVWFAADFGLSLFYRFTIGHICWLF